MLLASTYKYDAEKIKEKKFNRNLPKLIDLSGWSQISFAVMNLLKINYFFFTFSQREDLLFDLQQ